MFLKIYLIFITHLLKLIHHGSAVAPGPWGPLVKQVEEAGGLHPGPPTPPPAPHWGRRLTGSPGGSVGAKREEKEEQEKKRMERRQGGTAWLGLEGSGWRQTQSWVSHCGIEAPWRLREKTQASSASGCDLSERNMTRKKTIERRRDRRKERGNNTMLKGLCAVKSLM